MIYYLFIACHILGDYAFQPSVLARKKAGLNKNNEYEESAKKSRWIWLIVHSTIYTIPFIALVVLYNFGIGLTLTFMLTMLIGHVIVDFGKVKINEVTKGKNYLWDFGALLLDQVLHLLWMLFFVSNPQLRWAYIPQYHLSFLSITVTSLIKIIGICLFLLGPSSIFIEQVLSHLPANTKCNNKLDQNLPAKKIISGIKDCQNSESGKQEVSSSRFIDAGKFIGIMERLFVFFSLFTPYPQILIPIIVSIKGIARFPQLQNDKDFAESFIIGTVLSLALAISCIIFYNSITL